MGVLEMRAKARRLASEHGLHLLIVDYLQLMTGRGRFDNRTLELASISRGLKGLAKELGVPVVALVAVEPCARGAFRSPAAAVGPARVGRARAGRRRRADDLPARDVPGRQGRRDAARPRSSSPNSATVRPASSTSRSCASTRDSKISRGVQSSRGPLDRRGRRSRRHRAQPDRRFRHFYWPSRGRRQ